MPPGKPNKYLMHYIVYFLKNIDLFGCIRSLLRYVRSSFCHVRSSVAAHGLQSAGSVVVAWDLSSSTRDRTCVPCLARRILALDHQGSPHSLLLLFVSAFPVEHGPSLAAVGQAHRRQGGCSPCPGRRLPQ